MTSIGGLDLAALTATLTAVALGVRATVRRRHATHVHNETQVWLESIRCAETDEWLRDLSPPRPDRERVASR